MSVIQIFVINHKSRRLYSRNSGSTIFGVKSKTIVNTKFV